MSKVKVLLVGAAFSADLHMDGYSRCTDIAEIAAVCDKDINKAKELIQRYNLGVCKVYDDYNRPMADADGEIVDISLPNLLHHDVAVEACDNGKDVISETPLATTVEDAIEMVEAARKAGK